MTNLTIELPTVYPTQSWEIKAPQDWSGARFSSPNAVAFLNDFAYVYFRDNDDLIFVQNVEMTTSTDEETPWTAVVSDGAHRIYDVNGVSLKSQAPVTSVEINGQIYIFLNEIGSSSTTHIYKTRFITENVSKPTFAPIVKQFPNDYMMRFSAPAVAYNPLAAKAGAASPVMLIWAGGGDNGYYCAFGNVKENADKYGDDIVFKMAADGVDPATKVVPGTIPVDGSLSFSCDEDGKNFCGIVPYAYKGKTGFLLMLYYIKYINAAPYPTLAYTFYDAASETFLMDAPIELPTQYGNVYTNQMAISSVQVDDSTIVPVLIDQNGNTSNFMFSDVSIESGSWGPWQENPISTAGGGGSFSASVGVPPSISLSAATNDTDDVSVTAAGILSSGNKGGALIAGALYWPFIGDNKVAIATEALNFEILKQ